MPVASENPLALKETIRQHALELGFDACRFTTAAPPQSSEHFQRWLADGRHGELGYLQRNAAKRVQPQLVLDGARSIVCVLASYHFANGPALPAKENKFGWIARYARGPDYHDILGEKLDALSSFLDELGGPGTRSLSYVDTGPILERDLAQRAGLGFIGKHTNVISRDFGNWTLLGEILTTLDLSPDKSEKNRCGTCTRCITACPTNAIPAPFQLDARRCISYLTIELKSSIPIELRPAIGDRIFGCDDCLAACPWNRFAKEGRLLKEHARPDLAQLDLVELLSVDEAEFARRFAGTPMKRVKRRGLLRNVCVALGNIGDEKVLPALAKAATDAEPLISEHALWAITEIERRLRR